MTGCALSRGSVASYFAAGGRLSHDCELIRLGGVSKQLVSCLNRCFGEPRSGGMRRTRECVVACARASTSCGHPTIHGSVANFLLYSNQCRPASPIFYQMMMTFEVYNRRWMDHGRLDCAHQGHALHTRPGGSKIALVGPSCPSRVLRGDEAAGYGRGAAMGGGVSPLPREARKVELSYCSGGHRKQSVRARR